MFLKALFLVFLGLKLSGNIDWNWFIISIPLILVFIRFAFQVTLKVGIKENQKWAIKFIRWYQS
jgi:hypothetical protein